jgi:hypothetical protein
MVWTDPGSLSTASVARTHGGGNTPRPATTLGITERNVTGLITVGDAVNDTEAAATESMAMPPVNPVSSTSVR